MPSLPIPIAIPPRSLCSSLIHDPPMTAVDCIITLVAGWRLPALPPGVVSVSPANLPMIMPISPSG